MKLKPCPFCGGEDIVLRKVWGASLPSGYYHFCMGIGCRAYGPTRETEEEAIRAWNRRAKSEGESDE
jgi:Lar family restriction alleviation protein